MRCFVTGASGFLGQRVVEALLARDHQVRVFVRNPAAVARFPWGDRVEVVEGDLDRPVSPELLGDAEVAVHLAAAVTGAEEAQFAAAVAGSERLMAAVAESAVRRVVLAGSMAVYDWTAARGRIDEETPLEAQLYRRDGYAIAKAWQERVVREAAAGAGRELVVLRPGFIWGPGRVDNAGLGQAVGRAYLVFGARRRLPLTYVDNCAEAFALAAEVERAAGATVNVVDGDEVRAAEYARDVVAASPHLDRVVSLPGAAVAAAVRLAAAAGYRALGADAKLPGLFVPRRFDARFKDLRFPADAAAEQLGWRPSLPFGEAMERTLAATR
jgi:nucleoside-diphosphate-sugar epimerase